jgi:arylsulfatase
MTGRLPIRFGLASTSSGAQSVFTCKSDRGIPHNETTLAEHLQAAGYATKMVGKWHLGSVPEFMPPRHGFDE